MNAVKTIIIANQREFGSPIDPYLAPEELVDWRQEDFDNESISFFWAGDEKLVITSAAVSQEFIADTCRLLGYRALRTAAPAHHTDSLCDDIQNDPVLFEELVQTIQASDCPQILVWGASAAYYRLIQRLENLGLAFLPAEVPPPATAWTQRHFGSKAGFRALAEELTLSHPQVKIPEGFTCPTLPEALTKADYFAAANRPFLLKTNEGAAGWGIIVFNPSSSLHQPTPNQIEKMNSGIWQSGPVVVEEYITCGFYPAISRDRFPLIPTVNALITPAGEVLFQFAANMVMEELTQYHGAALGRGVLPAAVETKVQEIVHIIGGALAARGYRGWFDVDLVANEQYELFCNEVNARRSSVVHAADVYKRLKAHHPQIQAALSNDSWVVPAFDGRSYPEIKASLQDVLFPIANQPHGLLITLVADHGKIGFVIVGEDFADVMRIKRTAEALVLATA